MEVKSTEDIRNIVISGISNKKINVWVLTKDNNLTYSAIKRFLNNKGSITTDTMFSVLEALGVKLTVLGSSPQQAGNYTKEDIVQAFVDQINEYKANPNRGALDAQMIEKLAGNAAENILKLLK